MGALKSNEAGSVDKLHTAVIFVYPNIRVLATNWIRADVPSRLVSLEAYHAGVSPLEFTQAVPSDAEFIEFDTERWVPESRGYSGGTSAISIATLPTIRSTYARGSAMLNRTAQVFPPALVTHHVGEESSL
jgi:hypothetical protein